MTPRGPRPYLGGGSGGGRGMRDDWCRAGDGTIGFRRWTRGGRWLVGGKRIARRRRVGQINRRVSEAHLEGAIAGQVAGHRSSGLRPVVEMRIQDLR